MRYFLAFITIITLLSCNDERAKKQLKFSDNYQALSDSLKVHLKSGLENLDNSIGIEDYLSKDVFLVGIGFVLENDSSRTLVLELNKDITNDIVTDYTFGVEFHLFEKDKNQLLPYSKSKNRLYDLRPFTSELYTVGEYKYVISNIGHFEVQKLDKIMFYLYPKSGYEGKLLGSKITLYDYMF